MKECSSNNFIVLISSIKKKLYKILSERVKEYNLSLCEAIYLVIIKDNDSISFKELTKCAHCDKGMTTKVISSLSDKGLIYVDKNKKNSIMLNSKGKSISSSINILFDEVKNSILMKVNYEEVIKFYDMLNRFNQLLEGSLC